MTKLHCIILLKQSLKKKTKNKKYNLIFKLEKNATLDSELAAVDPHHKNTIFTMNVLFTTNHK